MDREAWQATVYGVARVGCDSVTKPPQQQVCTLAVGGVDCGGSEPATTRSPATRAPTAADTEAKMGNLVEFQSAEKVIKTTAEEALC